MLVGAVPVIALFMSLAGTAQAQPTIAQADSVNLSDVYEADEVSKPVKWRHDGGAELPANAPFGDSHVKAGFVIDTTGRAELATFQVESSPDPALTASVREYLKRRARYDPAERRDQNGVMHRVRQFVRQEFLFHRS